MSAPPKPGQAVEWLWGAGTATGKIAAVHEKDVTKTIKGHKIMRHATPDKPALEIITDKGRKVLKSVTETKTKNKIRAK